MLRSTKRFVLAAASIAILGIYPSCTSNEAIAPEETATLDQRIPSEVVDRLQELCFYTDDLYMKDGNYIVEGDIVISPAELATLTDEVNTTGPSGEQYRTCNIVSAPRTITVAGSGLTGTQDQALDMAVDNFNGLNLSLNFQRVYSGKADITVRNRTSNSAGGSAGFPSKGGKPYGSVTIYSGTDNYGLDVVEHVMTHEIGHCVGLRHTDYFNRSYSCGGGGNEGGCAIHIPGTPTGADRNSVMLACFSANESGEFSSADKTALQYLY